MDITKKQASLTRLLENALPEQLKTEPDANERKNILR